MELVDSRIRFFSRLSPCAGPWGYRHGGRGRRGGGTRSPSPVSHAPDTLLLASPIPPGLQPAGYPYALCRPPPLSSSTLTGDTHTLSAGNPHPARAFGAPPPPPPGGRVRAWRYQGSNRIRGGTGGQPCSALLQDLPMCWTVGNIATGGGGLRGGSLREGGTRSPSPVSRAQNALLLRHPHLPEGGQRPADLMHPASPGAQGSAARRSAGGYPLKKARTGRVTPQSLPLLPQPQEPRDLPLLPPGAGTSLS